LAPAVAPAERLWPYADDGAALLAATIVLGIDGFCPRLIGLSMLNTTSALKET
jgi:hypothetical protein